MSGFVATPESGGTMDQRNQILSILSLPLYYLVSRWSLVFPSSAIGMRRMSLRWSWQLSAGNGWRLTLLIGLPPVASGLLFSLLPTSDSIFLAMLVAVAWPIVIAIEIGLLSLSYAYLAPVADDHEGQEI